MVRPEGGIFEFKILGEVRKSFRFTAGHKKDIAEGLDGSNDMTSLTALLLKWSLIRQIRERAGGLGLERMGVTKM